MSDRVPLSASELPQSLDTGFIVYLACKTTCLLHRRLITPVQPYIIYHPNHGGCAIECKHNVPYLICQTHHPSVAATEHELQFAHHHLLSWHFDVF